jgi:hypothetical protein
MGEQIQIGPFTVQWAQGELFMIGMDCQPVLSGKETQALLEYLYDRKDAIYQSAHANDARDELARQLRNERGTDEQ